MTFEKPMVEQMSGPCRSLPTSYVAHWCVANGKVPNMLVDKIDNFDPAMGLRQVFAWLTGLGADTWWAPRLHIGLVLTRWSEI